jgi:glycosyltransferase involved in cell wall biosynthesis
MITFEQKLVSVIIPVYNGARFLGEAINNVLKQDYQPLEIIVVDDGSTDNTGKVAAKFQDVIHYIYQPNTGPSAARNCGLKAVQGEFITFLDVDDLWSEDKLKVQTDYLVNNPNIGIVQGLIQQMVLLDKNQESQPLFKPIYQPYQFINLGSAVYRKSVFKKIGFFDETLKYGEDVDWFIRAWENGVSKVVLEEVSLFYRKHNNNMTEGKNLVHLGFVRIFKKHLDRLRKSEELSKSRLSEIPIHKYLGSSPEVPKIV